MSIENGDAALPRKYRKDYAPPPYVVETYDLSFDLDYDETTVTNVMVIRRKADSKVDLLLNGEELKLVSLELNGKTLEGFKEVETGEDAGSILIPAANLPDDVEFTIKVVNVNYPSKNSKLMGLYKTKDILLTHNEPTGFRRIVYSIDRPDNMSIYTVTLYADKEAFPVLLANGDCVDARDNVEGKPGKHMAVFKDAWRKPAHLFAVVAGRMASLKDVYVTGEGRRVSVEVYSPPGFQDQLEWALECTKTSMKFDEEKFGRYYDCNTCRVVAAEDFNMGAMENKSLIIFNISCLVAKMDRTTVSRYERIMAVVGHEYFHNWSGNRVSVRDWFQITLKEGFTNYRENLLVEHVYSKGAKRIENIQELRGGQFPQDASSQSHCIRPESYVTVDNFYTDTVYTKGGEVCRMYNVLLGDEVYRKATDLYFSKYDGQAISCDEFRGAMQEASGIDMTQFELWYKQRGTPVVEVVERKYDAEKKTYTLRLRQTLPANASEEGAPQAMHIPVLTGLIAKEGEMRDVVPQRVLQMRNWEDTFVFDNVSCDVVPSVLRGLSAPVKLTPFLTDDELMVLMLKDTDAFNSWEAGQVILTKLLAKRTGELMSGGDSASQLAAPPRLVAIWRDIVHGKSSDDPAMIAKLLELPQLADVTNLTPGLAPSAVLRARDELAAALLDALETDFRAVYDRLFEDGLKKGQPNMGGKLDTGNIHLRCTLLGWLTRRGDLAAGKLCLDCYERCPPTWFTERSAAVACVQNVAAGDFRARMTEDFYKTLKAMNEENALDNWFQVQVRSRRSDLLEHVTKKLLTHPDYAGTKTPNRLRAVASVFAHNDYALHQPSGEGYKFIADRCLEWDRFNPHISSVLAIKLTQYAAYDQATKQKMISTLKSMVQAKPEISSQLREIVEPAAN